jgi:hypothetical protein
MLFFFLFFRQDYSGLFFNLSHFPDGSEKTQSAMSVSVCVGLWLNKTLRNIIIGSFIHFTFLLKYAKKNT